MAKGGKSSSSVATTNQSMDKRIAVESGIGISSDSSTINVQSVDGEIVKRALDVMQMSDATAGEGFKQLLTLADKVLVGTGEVIERTQEATMAQIGALTTATNDKAGVVDQKTMLVVAGLAAAAYIVPKLGKK